MDYDKLIERLNTDAKDWAGDRYIKRDLQDAAIAIETLRADLARVTAERDAAIEDLEEIMFKGGHNIDTCHFCANGQCYRRGGTQVCNPLWRGIMDAVKGKSWKCVNYLPAPPDKDNNVLAKTPNESLTLEQLRASPHGKIKDSTLQSICNRANEIARRPLEEKEAHP